MGAKNSAVIIYIKNMVCNRCILAVRQVLQSINIKPVQVNLGEVQLSANLTANQMQQLTSLLQPLGFEVLDNKRQRQIEKIKSLLIAKIQSGNLEEHFSISDFLKAGLLKDYSSISRLFSQVEGMTIEQFFIAQKVEKIKEWLVYDELSLSEMAFRLGYSSVAHLSAQFKKITGLTPSQFKQMGGSRKAIDSI